MKTLTSLFLFTFLTIIKIYPQQFGWVDISSRINTPATTNFSDVYFVSGSHGIVSAANQSEVYTTSDGGQSFTSHTVPNNDFLNSVCMLNISEYFGGSQNNRIYHSTDGGNTWVSLGSTGNPVRSVTCFPSSSTAYSCGDHGSSNSINSAGITNLPTGLVSNLYSVSFPTSSEGWLCGGSIIRHFANGVWNADQTYAAYSYNGICFVNNTNGWAVGDNGVIIRTIDGKNWVGQTNPDTQSPKRTLNDVCFLNSNEGWAVGNAGVILHTTDGGISWAIEADGLTTSLLRNVFFTSSTNGYITGNEKTLLNYSQLTSIDDQTIRPDEIRLEQNFPNPFSNETGISYSLAVPKQVKLTVHTIYGNQVALLVNEFRPAGSYFVRFDGRDLPAGVYYIRLQSDDLTETRKMIKTG